MYIIHHFRLPSFFFSILEESREKASKSRVCFCVYLKSDTKALKAELGPRNRAGIRYLIYQGLETFFWWLQHESTIMYTYHVLEHRILQHPQACVSVAVEEKKTRTTKRDLNLNITLNLGLEFLNH